MCNRELLVRLCGNSWVCCDGECAECPATKLTTSNRTEVTNITLSIMKTLRRACACIIVVIAGSLLL